MPSEHLHTLQRAGGLLVLATYGDFVPRAAGLVGHAALLLVLVKRRRARSFPVFTSLILYNFIEGILLLWSSRTGTTRQQYLFYWCMVGVGYLFEIGFIFELALKIMGTSGVMVKQSLKPFLLYALTSLIAATYLSRRLSYGTLDGWDLWDMRATYFATCLTCFLYLGMLMAVNLWHLPWRSHMLILGQGFAVWQLVSTLMDSAHVWFGWRWADKGFDSVSRVAYLFTLAYWAAGLWFPERDLHRAVSPESEAFILSLTRNRLKSPNEG